jgi:hypothetical protein
MSSVDDFESRYLPVATSGRTSLYQRINGLIGAYNLVNTTGPDYAPLETLDVADGVETDEERGRSKYKSLFPGVYVTMTVGQPGGNPDSGAPAGFQNVPFGGQPAQTSRPKGKMHGEVVSLRLEMAAYFKRTNLAPVVPQPEAQ